MAFLTPILEAMGTRDDLRCTLFFGKHLPSRLKSLPAIDNREPLAWEQFKQWSAQERYHIVLAPLPETPFNRGRSLTKLMDVASVGAAGLFSARRPFSQALEHNRDGLLLADDPVVWGTEIERLLDNLQATKILAQSAAITAQRLGSRQDLRSFWLRCLQLKGE